MSVELVLFCLGLDGGQRTCSLGRTLHASEEPAGRGSTFNVLLRAKHVGAIIPAKREKENVANFFMFPKQ